MYNIVICDDEKVFVLELQEMLAQYADKKGMHFRFQIYYDGQDLLDNYQDDFDLIFLDIKMKNVDGLKTAEGIRKRDKEAGLIFLTSLAEHVWKGYEFGAANYLLKPLSCERLEMELDRFFAVYPGKEERFLIVTNDNGKYKLFYKKIRFIETVKRNVLIHYEEKQFIFYQNMKKTVLMLTNETAFAQCHASFLVNLSYVTGVENMEAVLSTGERIPISHPKRKDFMLKLAGYWTL